MMRWKIIKKAIMFSLSSNRSVISVIRQKWLKIKNLDKISNIYVNDSSTKKRVNRDKTDLATKQRKFNFSLVKADLCGVEWCGVVWSGVEWCGVLELTKVDFCFQV